MNQRHPNDFLHKSLSENVPHMKDDDTTLSDDIIQAWKSLPSSLRSSLISVELGFNKSTSHKSTISNMKRSSGVSLNYENKGKGEKYSLLLINNVNTTLKKEDFSLQNNELLSNMEYINESEDATITLKPVERAPTNVYELTIQHKESPDMVIHGWRNVFDLSISYDIQLVKHGSMFNPDNLQLLHSTGENYPQSYKRRFAVVDNNVYKQYGTQIHHYFQYHDITLVIHCVKGGEAEKRMHSYQSILDALCVYKLRRREPFFAIGGGVLLDIAGMAAGAYRRGVPFIRVPTTLLAIVDASVGVKNGIDYHCNTTNETYKNRVGSFYAPLCCLLDPSFIATQDERNICNGFGEIMKLSLVRSMELFILIESYGKDLIKCKFQDIKIKRHAKRIIELSIKIMLEELGPNLWESTLSRCVDYGHTFSKLLEMIPNVDMMHGEAVNIDGFFCVILSYLRGYIEENVVHRIYTCMTYLSLPTHSPLLTSQLAWQSCLDAIEHRHGKQRIPLITGIGESKCVSDVTREELSIALDLMNSQFALK